MAEKVRLTGTKAHERVQVVTEDKEQSLVVQLLHQGPSGPGIGLPPYELVSELVIKPGMRVTIGDTGVQVEPLR